MVREVETSEKNSFLSEPISIGTTDFFLEVKSDGNEVSIRVVQTNLKGLEIEVLSVTEEL